MATSVDRASAEIALRGDITMESGWKLYAAIRDAPEGPLELLIDSDGGDFLIGLRAYNALRRRKGTLARIVKAESTAVLVALGCERVEIAAEGRIMIHAPRGDEHTLHDLTFLTDQLACIYAERTGLAKAAIARWLQQERRMSATEALRLRFADAFC